MNCPDPERAAAAAEGRLDPAEDSLYLEHCADCEACRHELALLSGLRERAPSASPEELRRTIRRTVLRAVARQRRRRQPPGGIPLPALWIPAAAVLLVALGGMIWAGARSQARPALSAPPLAGAPAPPAGPFPGVPGPAEVTSPVPPVPPAPEEKPAPATPPEIPFPGGAAPPSAPDPSYPPAPPPAVPPPAPETVPVPPPGPAAVPTRSRTFGSILVTDAGPGIRWRRGGGPSRTPAAGPFRVNAEDLLWAESAAGLRLEGGPGLVLGTGTRIVLACASPEQAPYLRLQAGEVVVEPQEPSSWILSDGRVEILLQRAAGRFVVYPVGDRLAAAALGEPLYALAGGNGPQRVGVRQVLVAGRGGAEVRPADPADLQRIQALFEAERPRRRTLFYTSCDPADVRRGHVFLLEGTYLRQEAVLSLEGPGRSASVAIVPNPRFPWKGNLVLGFRFATNATAFQVGLRVEERKYTLWRGIPVERRHVNQWRGATVPLSLSSLGFTRDDGQTSLVVGPRDLIDAVRFTVQGKDVYGDQRAYIAVDDVEVYERE